MRIREFFQDNIERLNQRKVRMLELGLGDVALEIEQELISLEFFIREKDGR